jgi:transposase
VVMSASTSIVGPRTLPSSTRTAWSCSRGGWRTSRRRCARSSPGLGDDARVALEAAFGWEWLADLLEAEGIELHLAHPRRTKAIAAARVRTDAVDARTLAHLLRADLLPEAVLDALPGKQRMDATLEGGPQAVSPM